MASFEISKGTFSLLENFQGISNSLLIQPGKTQKTVAAGKSVLAVAEFPDAWPVETGVYDLSSFLRTLSLFKSPTITFGDSEFIINEGKTKVRYRYSDASTIQAGPKKTLSAENPDIEFKLSATTLNQLNKTCVALGLGMVTLSVEGGDVVLRASDPKNPSSHKFEYTVPDENVTGDKTARVELLFKTEHLSMLLAGDYVVRVAKWPYGHFKHATENVSYCIVSNAKV